MSEEPKRGRRERDQVVDAAVERCIAHMRKKSNGDWFPYEIIEELSGIKRYLRPDVVNKKWRLMVGKLKRGVQELPQENLDADDRGSFNIVVIIDKGFQIPPDPEALVHVGHKWSSQTKGAAKRARMGFGAIQQANLTDHQQSVRLGMINKAEADKKKSSEDSKWLALMLKKSD